MVVASGCWGASGEAEALGEGLEPLPPEHPANRESIRAPVKAALSTFFIFISS